MKIFEGKNKKRNITIVVILFLILSQILMVKLVYSYKIKGVSAKILANVYNLKAGTIEEEGQKIDISLKEFFIDKEFTIKASTSNSNISDQEISDIVWNKLLKSAWLKKIAKNNNIEVSQEDIDFYIEAFGGQDKLEGLIQNQEISIDQYKFFLIAPGILELKVHNYLLTSFADEQGVLKIQEAYALLEEGKGKNWDAVVEKYGEDTRWSSNSFWLSEEELIGPYEAMVEVGEGDFSKIVQTPEGYIIWYVDNLSEDEERIMREIRGLFVYAQGIEDFFNSYLDSVNINRKY